MGMRCLVDESLVLEDNRRVMDAVETSYSTRVRWIGLVAAASGMFLTALDITVNVALPDITESLGTDAVTIQWIIIFYVGSSTAMQLGLGGSADVFGLKRMFVFGLVLYMIAVLVIGLADDLALVFGLRVFQSVGNGLLMALAPAIVTRLFPSEFRGRALGIMAALGTLGMFAGSLGGGVLVDLFDWRAIFLGRVPLCLAALIFTVTLLRVPDDRGRAGGFDLSGSATLFVSMASLILLLSLGGREGWTRAYIPVLAAVFVVGLAAFVAIERRAERPVLQLSILRNRILLPALLTSMLAFISTFVNWFILPFFVVDALGSSASVWGVLLMVMTVANTVAAPLGGWLSDRANPAYAITVSLLLSTGAMFYLGRLDAASSVIGVAFGLVVVGVGTGLFQSSNANLIMGTVRADRLGMGGGIMGLSRGLGTVFSVAIMGAVFSARQTARGDASSTSDAFVLAYQDTYLIAGVIAVAAVIVSLSLWPWFTASRGR